MFMISWLNSFFPCFVIFFKDEMSQYSSRPSSSRSKTSTNPLTLSHLKNRVQTPENLPQTVNKSGKSVISEKRFMDGITDSPMGSHKSSTPDHRWLHYCYSRFGCIVLQHISLIIFSLMDGWKYTRDSEYVTGSIKCAESESSRKYTTSSATPLSTTHSVSSMTSR